MLRPGDRLGPFAITGVLGAGAMGAVFSAVDERLRRDVALKIVHGAAAGMDASRRLIREARIAASLDHPGIVRIHELGEHEGEIFIAMELVRGASLAEVLAERGPAPLLAVAWVGVAIARATAVAHAAGIVHRDLKPKNVVVRADGVVKVLDFGLAKALENESAQLSMSGAVSGTPAYLAPELLDGAPPSAATDAWSLGIMLFELASGTVPFDVRSLPKLLMAIANTTPDLSAVPASPLRDVIGRILSRDPAERLATMGAIEAALAPLADEDALRDWATPVTSRPRPVLPAPEGLLVTPAPLASTRPMTPISALAGHPVVRLNEPEAPASPRPPSAPGQAPPAAPHVGASTMRVTASRSGATRPLDEELLDELAERIASFPEPVAALATSVEVARAEGDATGVRKRLFELGVGVVRYAVAYGLAALAAKLGSASAPRPVAEALRKAARLSDGQWCDLARAVGSALRQIDPAASAALAFAAQKPLADLVASRNEFIHRGGAGNDAGYVTTAVLDSASALLSASPRVVATVEPPAFEARVGVPVRAGVWKKTRAALPSFAEAGAAYLCAAGAQSLEEWTPATPWLPLVEKKLLLVDAPHAPGKVWRWLDPESGEHREHPALDRAVRALVGEDASAPRELTDRPALVGRAPVIQAMRRAAEEAAAGGIRVVLLTGPFGIGRSRMLQTLSEAAAGFGFGRVLEAACSAERRGPLRPLHRSLEGAPGLERAREAVARAMAVDPLATRGGLDALLEAVEEALVEASLEEAIVLSVDDVQWADEQTLAVLRLLTERATRRANGRLVVVATARDEPSPSPALRRFVGQVEADVGSGATRVGMGPLGDEDALRLVKGVAPLAAAIEGAVVAGAGGVPFFLVQPLLVWNETGSLEWRDGAWQPRPGLPLGSPPGVRELVQARLSSYFDPGSDAERAAQHVLACVGLYGSGLPIDWLVAATEAAGTKAIAAEHALEALVEAGLLVVRGERHEHDFAQAVVRQAVLDDLKGRPWFRRVQRALLDSVAASDGADADAAFLARGFEQLGVKAEAAAWLRRAIDRALATGSFEEAIELGEKLAKTGRDPAERTRGELGVVDAMLRAGRAKEASNRLRTCDVSADALVGLEARVLALRVAAAVVRDLPPDHDPRLLEDVDASGEPRLRIEARLSLAAFARGKVGLAAAEEAVRLSSAGSVETHYRALACRLERLEELATDPAERRSAAARARDVARELGSVWAELDAETYVAAAEVHAGAPATAIPMFRAVVTRAAELRFGTLQREALISLAQCEVRVGNVEEAATVAGKAGDLARTAGDMRLLSVAQSLRADALLQGGKLLEARAAITEAAEIALSRQDYTATVALLRRSEISATLGDLDVARADAARAAEMAEAAGNADHAVRARLLIAIHTHTAAEQGARQIIEQAVAGGDAIASQLRPPTLRLLERARRAIAG